MDTTLYRRINNQLCINDMVHLATTGESLYIDGKTCEASKVYILTGKNIFTCEELAMPNNKLPCNGCKCTHAVQRSKETLIDFVYIHDK